MPRLVPASSLVSPAVSIRGSQLRAGPAEHLQPCQHQHPAAAGGAPREQHLPVPPPGSHWSATALCLHRRLIGQRQLCPSPGVSLVSGSSVPPPESHWSAAALSLPRRLIVQRQLRPSPGVSLVSGSSVPPPGSHWSAAALSLPRALIGQRQLCPSPGVSLLSGSSAGSHWLSRRARERPLGAGSVRRGSRQRSAAPAARAAPQESAASAGAVRAAASRKPRHNGSEC